MEDGRGFILFSFSVLSGLSVTFYSFSSRVSQFFSNFARILCFSLDKASRSIPIIRPISPLALSIPTPGNWEDGSRATSGWTIFSKSANKTGKKYSYQVFFVSLERKAILLYIKAVRRIEKKRGYELATVLNSTFCYELHSKNSRHRAISRFMTRCRVQRYKNNLE